jgi:large subunit ribosomal protein L9
VRLLLRSDVSGVGKKGDIIEVADGYGRNYLVPKGLAISASSGIERQAGQMRRSRAVKDASDRAGAEEIARTLVPTVITVTARAGNEGKLFGSVTASDVADAVRAQTGIVLDRKTLAMTESIKTVGTHAVGAKLHSEVEFQITVEVQAG